MEFKENMTKEEFEKAIQSAEDKVRTDYVKKVKDLESKLPPKKSDKEIELETKEKELLAKEREYKIKDVLEQNELPSGLSKYISADDIESAGQEISTILNEYLLNNSHKPKKHNNGGDSVTKEQFKNMNYTERLKLEQKNPELYKKLAN
jgi:hypothetical protein